MKTQSVNCVSLVFVTIVWVCFVRQGETRHNDVTQGARDEDRSVGINDTKTPNLTEHIVDISYEGKLQSIAEMAVALCEYGTILPKFIKEENQTGKEISENFRQYQENPLYTFYERIISLGEIAKRLESDGKDLENMIKTSEDNETTFNAETEITTIVQNLFEQCRILNDLVKNMEKIDNRNNWINIENDIQKSADEIISSCDRLTRVITLLMTLLKNSKRLTSLFSNMNLLNRVGLGMATEISFDGYEDLGNFSLVYPWIRDKVPFHRAIEPWSPDRVNTKIFLYTRNQPEKFFVQLWPHISLQGSYYDPNKYTVFIVHGYLGNPDLPWMLDMKDALLWKYDANVFLIGWEKGAGTFNYCQAASNTRVVGAEMTRLGLYLTKYTGAYVARFHAIGFSLGAHISSYFAKGMSHHTGQLIGQFTALDPAAPLFEPTIPSVPDYDKAVRLDRSDAQFVQVIHTSARMWHLGGMGMMHPSGHVDFYMNGGAYQPGCIIDIPPVEDDFFTLLANKFKALFNSAAVLCHHNRAVLVYIASLRYENSCRFWGYRADVKYSAARRQQTGPQRKCSADPNRYVTSIERGNCSRDHCIPLGSNAVRYPARGIFVVKTTGSDPYCDFDPETERRMFMHTRRKFTKT